MGESKKFSLSTEDWKRAGKSALEFFSIPAIFYVTAVLGVLQVEGHVFSFKDLVPTTLVINSIVTWAFMQLLGLFKRYSSGK